MISYLIDINVWLALTWDQHPQHVPASRWHVSIDDAEFLFCRFTMLGFLRLLTNRQVMAPHSLQPATKAIADCYLVGFAEAAGAHMVTFDRGLAATAQFRQVPLTLLEPFDRTAPVAPSSKPRRGGRHSPK